MCINLSIMGFLSNMFIEKIISQWFILYNVQMHHVKTPRISSTFRNAYCCFMKRERLVSDAWTIFISYYMREGTYKQEDTGQASPQLYLTDLVNHDRQDITNHIPAPIYPWHPRGCQSFYTIFRYCQYSWRSLCTIFYGRRHDIHAGNAIESREFQSNAEYRAAREHGSAVIPTGFCLKKKVPEF